MDRLMELIYRMFDEGPRLSRISPVTGENSFIELNALDPIPRGENVGEFAPIPEPNASSFFLPILLYVINFRRRGRM